MKLRRTSAWDQGVVAERRRRHSVAGMAAMAALVSGCNSDNRPEATVLPPPPARVQVTATEYRFDNEPEVRRGRVVVHMRNAGQEDHQLVLVRLPDDLETSLEEQLRSDERRPAQTLQLIPDVTPGGDAVFAVDLAPGRYGFICFLTDDDGQSHALKGMSSELRVS